MRKHHMALAQIQVGFDPRSHHCHSPWISQDIHLTQDARTGSTSLALGLRA